MSGWQWLCGTVGENGMKFPCCAPSLSGTSLFGSLGWKQPLPASPHGHHLPANSCIPKRNDSHISVWYFLDWNCCTCAMWSVSSMFNTSQAAAGKCSVQFVWKVIFSWDSFNIHSLSVAWEVVDESPEGIECGTLMQKYLLCSMWWSWQTHHWKVILKILYLKMVF